MATNLETLELTIQGNATSAKAGIDSLISSLSSLPAVVRRAAREMQALNAQLEKLKRYQRLKLPSFGTGAPTGGTPGTPGTPRTPHPATAPTPDPRLIAQGWTPVPANQVPANIRKQFEEAGNAGKTFGDKVSSAFKRVNKMASTMILRTVLKAIIKDFKQAWESAYNFSKKMGGAFARNVDAARNSLYSVAINIVRMLAPAMQIITPIVNTFAAGVQYLAEAISSLLSLLGIANELFGTTTENIAAAGGSSSKSAKEALAAFDELNVISNESGSGGGGGSGGSTLTGRIQEEIEAVKLIIGEALLAVGLILAFSGHIGIGLALAAVGAAAIVGTVAAKWGEVSDQVKGEMLSIMAIAGTAFMALGLILAFSGVKVGLGIALIAAGAANLVAAAALSWNLDDEVKQKIGNIMAIAGGSLLAIGAILALTGVAIPLGVAMMAAGGVSLVASVALNWNSLKDKVVGVFDKIRAGAEEAWGKVKKAIGDAWDKYMGWTGIKWSDISQAWDEIKKELKKKWELIGGYINGAWEKFSNWTTVTWDAVLAGNWDTVGEQFGIVWNGIQEAIGNAWNQYFSNWTGVTWSDISTGWEDIKTNLTATWEEVKLKIWEAWGNVKTWINAKWSALSSGWDEIKENLKDVWVNVASAVSVAWDYFKDWINTGWGKLQTGWDAIKKNLVNLWGNIQKKVSDAWEQVKYWINMGWSKLQTGWNAIQKNLKSTWGVIQNSVSDAWAQVKNWINMGWAKLQTGWNAIQKNLTNAWNLISGSVTSAWEAVKVWWDEKAGSGIAKIKDAWGKIRNWFHDWVTEPIANFFKGMVNGIIGFINSIINGLNKLAHIHWDAITLPLIGEIIPSVDVTLFYINPISLLKDGAYDIPKGQLFIANEAGAEMVGSLDGKTAVANQQQIIEGIRRGVADGQEEQNNLLRRQNEILLDILAKDFKLGASSALGRTVEQSMKMYQTAAGRV